jgi:hypothetical protein
METEAWEIVFFELLLLPNSQLTSSVMVKSVTLLDKQSLCLIMGVPSTFLKHVMLYYIFIY